MSETMSNETNYPATCIVHCPSGPTNACELHADQVEWLMQFMGAHTVRTPAEEGVQCDNCVNEAKNRMKNEQ